MEAHPDREALTQAAAGVIADAINAAIAERGRAGAVLTGGSTPGPIYDSLSSAAVDWRKVTLTVSDERWVPAASDLSNERLVRTRLMTGNGLQASFLSLKGVEPDLEPDLESAASAANRTIAEIFPTDVTLLGVGGDGHIASIFPKDRLAAYALDPAAEKRVIAVPMSGLEPFLPRLSLTLAALLASRLVLICITGEAKRVLLERAAAGETPDLPVAALFRHATIPVRVLWSP